MRGEGADGATRPLGVGFPKKRADARVDKNILLVGRDDACFFFLNPRSAARARAFSAREPRARASPSRTRLMPTAPPRVGDAGEPPPAIVLAGPRGSGKTTFANRVVREFLAAPASSSTPTPAPAVEVATRETVTRLAPEPRSLSPLNLTADRRAAQEWGEACATLRPAGLRHKLRRGDARCSRRSRRTRATSSPSRSRSRRASARRPPRAPTTPPRRGASARESP